MQKCKTDRDTFEAVNIAHIIFASEVTQTLYYHILLFQVMKASMWIMLEILLIGAILLYSTVGTITIIIIVFLHKVAVAQICHSWRGDKNWFFLMCQCIGEIPQSNNLREAKWA